MSHYVESPMKITDQAALVAALNEWFLSNPTLAKRMGKVEIEVHEQPKPLVGYESRRRPEHAHVIVRRGFFNSASNDLGFRRNADGTFTAIVSDYDRSSFPKIEQQIAALAGVHAAMGVAKRLGRQVERRVDAKGRHQLVVLAR